MTAATALRVVRAAGADQEANPEVTIRTSGEKKTVSLRDGMTIDDVLREAGVKPGMGARLFVGSEPATSSTPVKAGDEITVAPRIRNGA